MKITLEKGRGTVTGDIAGEKILAAVTGKEIPALDHNRVNDILTQGIRDTAPPDISRKKIAVIIPDDTRLWARGDLFVPGIVRCLNQDLDVPFEQITIVIALGTHADIPADRLPALAGEYCVGRVKILNSANQTRDRLVHIGETQRGTRLTITKEAWEADHIIIFGGLLHHLIAGFGGGRKYILPGIAGYDAIQQNHSLAFRPDGSPHPLVRQAQLEGNPIHQDMEEAARMFLAGKTACYAAVAANGGGDIFYADCGGLYTTFINGCQALDRACRPELPAKGDFALISAGGHRTDGQLYQSTKALFNAVNIVREGGEILFVAGCADGVGNPVFAKTLETFKGKQDALGKKLAQSFNMPAYVAFRVMDLLQRFSITLVSDLAPSQALALGFTTTPDITSFCDRLKGRGFIIPFAENILPQIREPDTP